MDTPADEDEKPSSSTANDAPIDAGMTSKSSSMTEVPSDCPMDQNDNAKPQEAVDVVPDKEPPSTSEHLTEQMKLTEKTRVGSDVPVIASDVAASAYEPPALSSDKDLAVENDSGDRASIEVVPAKEDSGDHNFIHQQIAGSSKDRMEWEASEEPEPAQTETPVDISELDGGDEAEEDGEQQLEEEQEKKTAEDLDDAALAEELLSANSMEGKALVLNAYDRVRKVQKPVSEETLAQVNTRAMMTELCCPICLDLLTETMTTKECLHRFCQECITMALLRGNKECPTCRKKLVSKRSLRADPKFDRLIALIFPDRSNFRKMQQSDVQLKVFKKTVKKRPWSHLIKLLQKTEKKREILRTRDEVRRASRSQSPVNLDDYELDSEDSDDTIPANNSTEDEEEDVDEDNEEDVEEDEQITASAEKSSTENAPEEDTLGRNVSRIRDKSSREKTQSPKPGTSKISTRSQSPKPGPSKMADYAPPSPRQGPSSAADNDSQIALEDSKSKRKMTIAQLEKLINGAPPAPGDEDETPDLEEYDDWGDDVEIVEDVNFSDGGEGDGDDEADDDDEVISVRFMRLPKKKTPPMESVEGTAPKKNTTKGKSKSRSQTPHSDSNETVFSICNSSEYEEVEEECEEDEEEEEAEELPEDEYDVNLEEGQEPAEGEYFEETEDQYDETCEDVDGDEFPEVAGEFDGLEEKFEDIHREEERAFAKEMEELDNIMDAVVEIKKEADGTEVVLQNEAVAEPALDKQNDENMDEGVVIVANFAVVRPPCSDIDVDYAMEGKSKDGIMPAKGLAPESKTANENKDEEKPEYMEGFSSLHLDKSIEQGHVATTGKTEGGSNDDNLEDDVEARKGSAMEQKQGNAIDKYHDAAKERDEEKSNEMIQKEAQKRSSYVDGSDEKKSDDVKFEIPAEGTAENPIDVVLEAMSNGESDSEYEDEDDEEIENLERKLRRNKEDFSALGATGEEPADKEAPVENTEDGEESDVTYDELDFMTEKELDEQWDNVREAIIEDPDGLLTELDKRRLENPDEETDLDRSVSTDVSTGASSLATSTTSSILDIPKDVMALYEKRKKEREEAEAKAAADAAAEAAAEAVASREREREAAVQEANQALQSQAQQAQAQFNAQLQAQMQSQQVQQAQQVADIQRLQHLLPTLLAAGLSPALVRDAFSGLHPNIVQQSLAAAAGMAMQAQAAATGQAQSAAANQAQAANQVQQVPRPPPTPTQTIGKNNVQMSIVQPAQPLHQLAPQLPQSRNAALNQIHMVKNEPMDSFASPSRPASSMNMGPGRDARPPSVIGIHGSPYGAVVGAAGPSGSIQIMGPNAAGPGPVGMHHPFAVPGARPPSAMPPPMRTPNHPGQPNPFAHLASAQQGGLTQGSPRVPPSPALQPQQQQQQMPNQPQYQQPRSPLPPASLKMLPPALQHMAQRNILTYQASMVQQAQQAQAQQAQQLPPQQQQQPSFSMPISAPNAGQPMQFQMPNVPAEELTPEMLQHLQNAMAHAKAQAQFHAQAQAQAHSQALARAQAQHGQPDQTPAQQAQAAQAQQQAAQAQVQQAQAAQAQAQHVQAQAQAAQAQAAQAQGQSQGQGRPPQNQQQLNQHLLAMMNPQIIQQFNASQIQAGANPAALAQQQVAAQQILMQTVGHLTPMLQPQLQQMMLNSQKAMQQGIPMPPPNSSQPSASRKRSPGPAVGNPPAKTPKSSKKGRPSHQQQQAAQQQAHQQAMQQAQQHHAQQQANLQAQQQAQQQFQQQAQQQVHQHVQQALQQAHQQAQQAQLRVQMQAQQQQQHAQLQQMQAHQHAQIQAQLQAHQHAQLQTQQHAQRVQQQPPQQQKRQGQQAQTQLQVQQQGQQKAQQPASQPAPAIQPMPATAQGQAQQRINPFAMPLPAHLLHGFPQEMVSQPTMMQIVQSGPQPSVQDLIAAAKPPGRPPVSATPQTGQQAQQQQAPPDRPDNAAPIQSLDFMQLHILQQVLQQQQAARLEQARQQVILQQRPHHQPDQGPNGMSQELNIVPRPVNVTPGPNFGMQQLIDTSENRVLPPPNSASSALATAAYLQSQLGYPPETQERIPLSPAPVTRGPATVETGPSVIQSSASITHEEMQLPRMETPKPLSYYLNRTVKTATSVPTTSTAATTNAGAPKQSPPEELSKPSTSQEVSVVTTTSANPAITTTQPTMAPMFVAPSPALGIAPPPPSLRLSPQPSTSAIAPPTAASNPEERLVNWLADHPSSPLQVEDSMEKELERRTEETEAADPPIKNPEEVINKKGESSEADLQIEAELMPTALLIKREVPPEMLTPRYIRAKAETTMGHLSSMLQLRAMEEASINSSDFDSDPVPNVPEPQHFYVINKEGGLHVKKIFLHESILAAQSAATRNEYLTIFYDSEPPAPNEKKSLLEQVIPENFLR